MDSRLIFLLILLLGLLNFLIRFLPAFFLQRFKMPQVVEDWLGYVPVATMAAIVLPALAADGDKQLYLSLANLNLLAALPTLLVAWKTRSLALTLAVGMVTMALLQRLWPV